MLVPQESSQHCVIKVSTADQALRILSKFSNTPPSENRAWFFRGQMDSKWGLDPSIFRGGEITQGRDLREYEIDLLFWLRNVLERRSEIPDRFLKLSIDNPNDIQSAIDRSECDWLLAFARHHGAPTRVIDWTRSHDVAAWFAAKDVWDSQAHDRCFSVFIGAHRLASPATQGDLGVRWLNPSGAGNPYLSAQKGILVLHDWSVPDQWKTGKERIIDEADLHADLINRTVLFRIDVPWTNALNMVQSVGRRGIDGVSMFPGNVGYLEQAKMFMKIRPPQTH